jgi:hypothetical protein
MTEGEKAAVSQIYRLVYRSNIAIVGSAEEVEAEIASIAALARRNNASTGLTGVLVHTGESFTQVLEGELAQVEATFDRIASDLRHTAVELIQFMPIPERSFDYWYATQVPQGEFDELWGDARGRSSVPPEQLQPVIGRIADLLRPAALAAAG